MKKILLGFIAIGLLTFVGCEKDDDTGTETTDSTETSSDDGGTDSDTGDAGTDSDEFTYTSVTIGTQEWMVENLRTTKYSDGTSIPNVTDDTEWDNLSTGAWCNYKNDIQYDSTYGKLYNFYAVETGKLCPIGWHVPTDADWTVLKDYLTANGHSDGEGKALKATSGWDWVYYEGTTGNGTDDYGWNGLPGGIRVPIGNFKEIGNYGYWWSSTFYCPFPFDCDSTTNAGCRNLGFGSDYLGRDDKSKRLGFSVRCLRD